MNITPNDATIASYEKNAGRYAAATGMVVHEVLGKWLDAAVEGLHVDANIFEIGSGAGRDAHYLQSKGYKVHCSDATKAFLAQLSDSGLSADYFNVLTDAFTQKYDLILADAVFLHMTSDQLPGVLRKVSGALGEGGRLAMTLKEGEGEEWTDKKLGHPRYFCYWTEASITDLLSKTGFQVVSVSKSGSANARWLNIIARVG